MDRVTVRNIQNFIPKINLRISASSWFCFKKYTQLCCGQVILLRFREGERDFSVFQNIQTDPEVHLVLFPNSTAVMEIKQLGSEDDRLLSSSATSELYLYDCLLISSTTFVFFLFLFNLHLVVFCQYTQQPTDLILVRDAVISFNAASTPVLLSNYRYVQCLPGIISLGNKAN